MTGCRHQMAKPIKLNLRAKSSMSAGRLYPISHLLRSLFCNRRRNLTYRSTARPSRMLRHLRFEENMIKHRTLLLVACLSVAGIAAGCQNDTAEDTTNSRSSGARIDNAARPIDPNTGLPMPPGTDVNRNNLGNTSTGAQQPGATGTGTASGRGTNTGTGTAG